MATPLLEMRGVKKRFGALEALRGSQDVFLKMMLTAYGGFGYGYILRHFVPRLRRLGVNQRGDHQTVRN
jgi:phosphotriesterase-related protein